MGVRYVKFGQIYVNPARVLFVADVYSLGEINIGASAPVKTGVRTSEVIKMLEDAMTEQPHAAEQEPRSRGMTPQAVLDEVIRYLEAKLAKEPRREESPAAADQVYVAGSSPY
jgi:hypothetical protein